MCEKVQGGVTYLETQPTGVKGKAEWGPRMTPAKIEHRTPPDEGLSPDEMAMAEPGSRDKTPGYATVFY